MESGRGQQSAFVFSDSESRRRQQAVQRLRCASALISTLISDELAGCRNEESLERLYTIKGALACVIEEVEKRLSTADWQVRHSPA